MWLASDQEGLKDDEIAQRWIYSPGRKHLSIDGGLFVNLPELSSLHSSWGQAGPWTLTQLITSQCWAWMLFVSLALFACGITQKMTKYTNFPFQFNLI